MKIDWDNYDQVLNTVKDCGWDLKDASTRLQDTKAIVLAAVKDNGWTLRYASKRLQDDEEIVLEAVKEDVYALYYASDRLRSDKSFILKLLMMFRIDNNIIDGIKKYMKIKLA